MGNFCGCFGYLAIPPATKVLHWDSTGIEPTTCRLASRDREHVLVLLVHGDRTHAAESRRSRRYWGQGGVLGVLARGGGATVNILQFHTLSQFLNKIITYHTIESVCITLNDTIRNSAFLVQLQIQFRVRKRVL